VVGLIVVIVFHFLDLEYISIRYYCRNVANCCLIQFWVMLGFELKFNSFEKLACRYIEFWWWLCLSEKIIQGNLKDVVIECIL
jgi:hypothetical protein